ncbi:hypothetical protein SADUNF_Sadunf17G0096200 [Salix dunnii]|uniref:Uncharacterized protein n=1 Tax=Salix dunnii TaxID=1413687 RepID=A0A835MNI6_9ROSI|nr:hypothetical protein SADUNF_Sadunf17G0096200 [Salix dunnii]
MGWRIPEKWWRKGPWNPEEDRLLIEYVNLHGDGRWSSVSRCPGKRLCRLQMKRKDIEFRFHRSLADTDHAFCLRYYILTCASINFLTDSGDMKVVNTNIAHEKMHEAAETICPTLEDQSLPVMSQDVVLWGGLWNLDDLP